MLEFSSHQLSRVRPDAESLYYKALTRAYADISEKLLTANFTTKKRLIILISEIKAELYSINKDFTEALPNDVTEIIYADSQYTYTELATATKAVDVSAHITKLPKSTMKEFVDIGTMKFFRTDSKGTTRETTATAKHFLNSIANKQANQAQSIILGEYAQGSSTETIVRKLRPILTTSTKRDVRTVVRTLLAEASGKSSEKFYAENAEFIDNYIFVATIDSKTSAYCMVRDGKRYDKKPYKLRNFHPNCRSVIQAVPYGYEMGVRPIVLQDGTILQAPDKNFSYMDAVKLYPQLLDSKPLSVQRYIKSLK